MEKPDLIIRHKYTSMEQVSSGRT